MSPIPDFTEHEQQQVGQILFERYQRLVPWELAEAELQLDPASEQTTVCPTLYWSQRSAEFVVCKVGESRFRCQFFYSEREQFGTGRDLYDDLTECVVTLLQVQADHERARAGVHGRAAAEDQDYYGPTLI